jgi:hypothetical protein
MYRALAETVLIVHLGFIVWVMLGALVTRGRPWLAAAHVISLVYGIVAELGPWPCPLTLAENFFEARGGLAPYQGPFLLHYLDALVYPNLPFMLLIGCGVGVCVLNLVIYGLRLRRYVAERRGAVRE